MFPKGDLGEVFLEVFHSHFLYISVQLLTNISENFDYVKALHIAKIHGFCDFAASLPSCSADAILT